MAEPTSTTLGVTASLTGGLVVLLGPVLGPWVTVLLAAFSGALWTMGRVNTPSRLTAAMLLARVMLTALVLTGGVAAVLANFMEWSLDHVLPGVAFAIGALGDKFHGLRDAAASRLRALIGGA